LHVIITEEEPRKWKSAAWKYT